MKVLKEDLRVRIHVCVFIRRDTHDMHAIQRRRAYSAGTRLLTAKQPICVSACTLRGADQAGLWGGEAVGVVVVEGGDGEGEGV
jgi:hypothetical protein